MADPTDPLVTDLRALGRAAVPAPDIEVLAARVASSVAGGSRRRRPGRRRAALAALAVLVALVATPPVRATVAEWFGFGAVRVEPGGSEASGEPEVPPVRGASSLADAAARAGFDVLVPAVLGGPDGVEVTADGGRVSMSWGSGADIVRLDQYAGTPDFALVKTAPRLQFVTVAGRDGLWFPTAHRVTLLDARGDPAGAFRVADHTMLVPLPDSTLRLEGPLTFAEAADLARTLEPVG